MWEKTNNASEYAKKKTNKQTKKEKGKNKEKKGTKNFEGQTFLKNRKVPF